MGLSLADAIASATLGLIEGPIRTTDQFGCRIPVMELSQPVTQTGMAAYLTMWGIFTALLTVSASRLNYAILTVFITLTILFFLLAIGQYNSTIHTIAGYEGILCGSTAIYTGFAELTNEVYSRTVLPLWPVKR